MRNYLRRSGTHPRVARGQPPSRWSPASSWWGRPICVGDAASTPHALTWIHDEFFASPVGVLSPGYGCRRGCPLRVPGPWARFWRHDWRRGRAAYLPEAPQGIGRPLFIRDRHRHERQVDDNAHGACGARKRWSCRLEHQRRQHDVGRPHGSHAGQGCDACRPRSRRDARPRRCGRRGSGRLRLPQPLARPA